MKGAIRIGGALAVGIVIILGAFYMKKDAGTEQSTGAIVATDTTTRSYIETADTNGNGTPDWEESLKSKVFETIDTPAPRLTLDVDATYTPPTTFTGKFSEAFFKDYMDGKIKGADYTNADTNASFVSNAVKAIDQNTTSKTHSRLELTIIPTSDEAVRDYGNTIAAIIKVDSAQNENEAIILDRALKANDPELLKPLVPIRDAYTKMLADTLSVSVPESLTDQHIALLNAYEAILLDIEAMQVSFTDPLYSLARVKHYKEDATALFTALQSIAQVLKAADAAYENTEPGAFFYLFKI